MWGGRAYQDQTGVNQWEGPWAANSSAAVHYRRSVIRPQRARLPHLEQEVEEGRRRFWDTKVRPGGVMKVIDLSLLPCLEDTREDKTHCLCPKWHPYSLVHYFLSEMAPYPLVHYYWPEPSGPRSKLHHKWNRVPFMSYSTNGQEQDWTQFHLNSGNKLKFQFSSLKIIVDHCIDPNPGDSRTLYFPGEEGRG